MKIRHFLSNVDHEAILGAIRQAEEKTTGKIHVYISHHKVIDPFHAAGKHFSRLHMDRTPERNAVLIFVAPKSHKFAILADQGLHQKSDEKFWAGLADQMTEYFKRHELTGAITHAIRQAGQLLAEHFPR